MVKSFESKTRVGNYGGFRLEVSLQDPLGEGWYGQDWEFSHEQEILKKFSLRPGAKIFDLGAHQSVVAMILAKEVGSSGKVLAIEAFEHNYKVGCDNKNLNNLQQLEVVHAAVGKTTGYVEFSDDLNGAIKNDSTSSRVKKVRSFSIDDLVKNYFLPDLIVMDIEGYEALALEGATETLTKRIDWLIEVHGNEFIGRFDRTVIDVLNPFVKGDYELYIASEGSSFVPYSADDPILQSRFFLMAHHK